MSYTREQEQRLLLRVCEALRVGGFQEAPTWRTRFTRRVRYMPGAPGFRLGLRVDPCFAITADRKADDTRWYLMLYDATSDSRRLLDRYVAALSAAGIDAVVDRSQFHKRLRAWIRRPIGDEDYDDDHKHDGGPPRTGLAEASAEGVARPQEVPEDGR